MNDAQIAITEITLLKAAVEIRYRAYHIFEAYKAPRPGISQTDSKIKRNSLLTRRGYLQVYIGENDLAEAYLLESIADYEENRAKCGYYDTESMERYTYEYYIALAEVSECRRLGDEMRLLLNYYDTYLHDLERNDLKQHATDESLAQTAKIALEHAINADDTELMEYSAMVAIGSGPIFDFAYNAYIAHDICNEYLQCLSEIGANGNKDLATECREKLGISVSLEDKLDFYQVEKALARYKPFYLVKAIQNAVFLHQPTHNAQTGLFQQIYGERGLYPKKRLYDGPYVLLAYNEQTQVELAANQNSVFQSRGFRIYDTVTAPPDPQTAVFDLKVLSTVRMSDKQYLQRLFGYLQQLTPVVHFYKTSYSPGTLRLSGDFSSIFLKTQQMRYCYGIGRFTGFGTNFHEGVARKRGLLLCFGASGGLCLQFCSQFSRAAWETGIRYIYRIWKQIPAVRSLLGAARGRDESG